MLPGREPTYTASDLIRASESRQDPVSQRLITDWVSKGLLDRPTVRGLGRGKGTVAAWPESQHRLFLVLLEKRREVKRTATLCNIPVSVWLLWGDEYVRLRQVRRALNTWVDTHGTSNHTKAKFAAEQTLVQLDHRTPARKTAKPSDVY